VRDYCPCAARGRLSGRAAKPCLRRVPLRRSRVVVRALEDKNDLVVIFATNFLAQQRATPEIIAALRTAGNSPRELVAAAAFGALQVLGATGWEGSAIGLMQGTRHDIRRFQLAGILARAGRSDGWIFVRPALTPDAGSVGVAMWSVAPFHGLKAADGTTIDAISVLRQLQSELKQRERVFDASVIESLVIEANSWSRRRGLAR
jgi:hypothetical protein